MNKVIQELPPSTEIIVTVLLEFHLKVFFNSYWLMLIFISTITSVLLVPTTSLHCPWSGRGLNFHDCVFTLLNKYFCMESWAYIRTSSTGIEVGVVRVKS